MSPVIAAVKDVDGMKKCFESECQTVFVLYGTICNIGGIVREIKKHGKYACLLYTSPRSTTESSICTRCFFRRG